MIESGSEELAGIQEHDRVPAELDSIQLVRGSRAMTETDCPSEREFPSWQDRDAKSGKFSAASLR